MPTPLTQRTRKIQAMNDAFRQSFIGGRVVLTAGTQTLEPEVLQQVVDRIQGFTEFTDYNDPYGEHDFGSFTHRDDKFFWKIDCFDRNLINHSPDSTNPHLTVRVLTIMQAEEY